MNRRIPEIHESVGELKRRFKSEQHPRRRARLPMRYLLKSGQARTRKEVAELLGVTRDTIGDWLSKYERGGISELLTFKTHPNRKLGIPESVLERMKMKLQTPAGFPSYKAIQAWLKAEFGLEIPYSTVHRIVRTRLKAKLKVPRPFNVDKDVKESILFKATFEETLREAIPNTHSVPKIRIFAQDESRFGLLPVVRKRITCKGVKPIGYLKYSFENYYLDGAVEPTTGENFFLEMPSVDGTCFQIFLDEFAQAYPDSLNLMMMDRATFHRKNSLIFPQNVIPVFHPAASPELNPIERLWQDIKDNIPYEIFADLEQLKDRVASILKNYTKTTLKTITGYA